MKKLIIAAAIVCAAAMSQAASYTWSNMDGTVWQAACGGDYWETVTEGTAAYFVFVDAYSQDSLVADFKNNAVDMTKLNAAGTGAINEEGGVSPTSATGDYTSNQQAYFAVLDDGKLFISSETTAYYDPLMPGDAIFGDQDPFSDPDQTPIRMAADGYQGAGWYAPEPTSGLLLLLGMAGLTLKGKRA